MALARSGSRELRAVKIPASYDAWRPPKRRKNDSEKIEFFWFVCIFGVLSAFLLCIVLLCGASFHKGAIQKGAILLNPIETKQLEQKLWALRLREPLNDDG